MVWPVLEDVRVTLQKGGSTEETVVYGGLKQRKGILLKQNSNILSKEIICGQLSLLFKEYFTTECGKVSTGISLICAMAVESLSKAYQILTVGCTVAGQLQDNNPD